MNTWYKIESWSLKIIPVQVVRETTHMLFIWNKFYNQEQWVRKDNDYFSSFIGAQNALINRITKNIEDRQQSIIKLRGDLETVKSMSNPEISA